MNIKKTSYPALLKDWLAGKLSVREKRCMKLGVYIVSFFYVLPLIAISFIMLIFLLWITRALWLI